MMTGMLANLFILGTLLGGPLPFPIPDFSQFITELTAPEITITFAELEHSAGYDAQVADIEANLASFTNPVADLQDALTSLQSQVPDLSAGTSVSSGLNPTGDGTMTVGNMITTMTDSVAAPFVYAKGIRITLQDLAYTFVNLGMFVGLLSVFLVTTAWMALFRGFMFVLDIVFLIKKLAMDVLEIMHDLASVAGIFT